MEGLGATMMAIGMIAAFLLVLGGIKLVRSKEDRGRGILMLVAAAVLVVNVAVLTICAWSAGSTLPPDRTTTVPPFGSTSPVISAASATAPPGSTTN